MGYLGFVMYSCPMKHPADDVVTLRCPNCRQLLSVKSDLRNRTIPCPNCQKPFLFLLDSPDLVVGGSHGWLAGAALLVLGSAAPFIMLASMAVSLALGPFALVIGPMVGLVIAIVLCGYVYLRAGTRWFWCFVGSGFIFSLLLQFWHGQARTDPQMNGNPSAMLEQASTVAKTLHYAVAVLWLAGAGYVWLRHRSRKRPEPNP